MKIQGGGSGCCCTVILVHCAAVKSGNPRKDWQRAPGINMHTGEGVGSSVDMYRQTSNVSSELSNEFQIPG